MNSGNLCPWPKGVSGNPRGRPKVVAEVRELARLHGPEAFARIVELMRSVDQRVALAASIEVLNRAYGKPGLMISDVFGEPVVTKIKRVIVEPRSREDPE